MNSLSFSFQARIVCRVFARPNGEAAKCNASFKNRDALRGEIARI